MNKLTHLPEIKAKRGNFQLLIPKVEIKKPGILGIFGHSGNGKSTYAEELFNKMDPDALFVPQWDTVLDLVTGKININLLLASRGIDYQSSSTVKRIQTLANALELDHVMEKKGIKMSGGERRRLVLLRAIAAKPKVLILDEPFVGLGARHERTSRQLLMEREKKDYLTILVSHSMELLWSLSSQILVFGEGSLLEEIDPSTPPGSSFEKMKMEFADSLSIDNIIETGEIIALEAKAKLKVFGNNIEYIKGLKAIAFWRDDAEWLAPKMAGQGKYSLEMDLSKMPLTSKRNFFTKGVNYEEVVVNINEKFISIVAQKPAMDFGSENSLSIGLRRISCIE